MIVEIYQLRPSGYELYAAADEFGATDGPSGHVLEALMSPLNGDGVPLREGYTHEWSVDALYGIARMFDNQMYASVVREGGLDDVEERRPLGGG